VKLIDMERDKPVDGLTSQLIAAIKQRMERGEQSLLFLNRRGYAPVICCESCGWISECTRCTSFMVLHRRSTGCAATIAAWRCASRAIARPAATSTCSRWDAARSAWKKGLQAMFPEARVLRIDADSTRKKGSAQEAFDTVHRGEVDILIGTQMVAKGHDFKLTLVGILNPDTALFSQDYRASERLFAQLMQVAGRAGGPADGGPVRGADPDALSAASAVRRRRHHDYDHFASTLLEEREQAALPPYLFQACCARKRASWRRPLNSCRRPRLLEHPGHH
jgi:primosomal protein N' (replication factor Y)